MKLYLKLIILLIGQTFFVSCGNRILFEYPLPKHRKNLSHFSEKIYGKYIVIDTILDKTLNIENDLYNISVDTEPKIAANIEIDISSFLISTKTTNTFYIDKSNFNNFISECDKEGKFEYTQIENKIKIISGVKTDTLFNIMNHDQLRKYKKNLVLNKYDQKTSGYELYMLKSINDSIIEIYELNEDDFLDCVKKTEGAEKSNIIENEIRHGKKIDMNNAMLKKLIRDKAFEKIYTIKLYRL